jgi:hypothetical protein
VAGLALLALVLALAGPVHAQDFSDQLTANGIAVAYPSDWTATRHSTMTMITKLPAGATELPTDRALLADLPQMTVTTERRRNHTQAVRRLRELSGYGTVDARVLQISGWPAVQLQYETARQQSDSGEAVGSETVLIVRTVVAVGSTLLRLEARLPSYASEELVAEVRAIGTGLVFGTRGDPEAVESEIQRLERSLETPARTPDRSAVTSQRAAVAAVVSTLSGGATPGSVPLSSVMGAFSTESGGASVPVSTGGGVDAELEIAVSNNGQDLVIGSNNTWYYSSDGGQTWSPTTTNSNDPSVAWGQSGGPQGTFYGANISLGTSSTSIEISTDGGATWNFATPAYTCMQNGDPDCTTAINGVSFPDQEHIAVDRWNVTAGGDQVYSAAHIGFPNYWGIVCSADSATTWSANSYLSPGGSFPRITVGADGFVYVVYPDSGNIMLDKFAPCETQTNPMSNELFYPRTVRTNVIDVACPMPGLNRCNNGNRLTSPVVAVDDTDPNHIYVSYANNTNPGDGTACTNQNLCDEDVIVQDSLNGGNTWLASDPTDFCVVGICFNAGTACSSNSDCFDPDRTVTVSSGVTARRFMPWVCSVGGAAYVSWFDRRAAFPGGTTVSNNSLSDYYMANAFLDGSGALAAGPEVQVNDPGTTDPQCEGNFVTGSPASWPGGTRAALDSDSCSVQPQLAGFCCLPGEIGGGGRCNPVLSSQNRCDFDTTPAGTPPCLATEICALGSGFPKYGDYNGNACGAGRIHLTWPSSVAPLASPPANNIDSFYSSEIVCCVPQIQVPGDIDFGDSCGLGTQTETLNVCNTGKENLQVTSITSDDDQFAVTDPLAGYPINISPDFCFPFEVNYTPDGSGNDAGTLTINNNDPINPALEVGVSGGVGVAEIDTFIADSGDFGEVCSGLFHDLNLTIQSNGTCPLEIDSVSLSGPDATDFELPDGSLAGTIIEAGNSLLVPVRFAPADFNPLSLRTASVDVESSTQGGDELALDQTPIEGTAPPPDIIVAIADSGDFGAVCKGDFHDLDLTLFNQGRCDLTISDITSFNFDVLLPNDLTLPLILSHDADFTLPLRYAPDECDDTPWNSSIQIISDSPGESPLAIGISGVAPCPNLVIDPGAFTGPFAFPATVVDSEDLLGCFSERSTNLRNTGDCPLTITDIQATGLDFTVMQPVSFPIVLPPGEETLDVTVRFTPESGGDPLAPDETTGTLTVSSDDPDASGDALLCGEGVVQSGIRTLVTDITIGFPEIVDSVDSMTVRSKGKGIPGPINLMFTDVTPLLATVCDNDINYHLNLETLPAVDTTIGNGKSHYLIKATEGNLQDNRTFTLDQCEFSEFVMELKSSDGGDGGECLLKDKGEACDSDAECCSGKCKGPNGGKTCK